MKEIIRTSAVYSSPEVDVKRVEAEGLVAASATPVVPSDPSWTEDNTWADYDGDIWFPQ